MKYIISISILCSLIGCATKSDISKIQTQIFAIKEEQGIVKNDLVETEASTSSANLLYDSANYYNNKAIKDWESAYKKLNKIVK